MALPSAIKKYVGNASWVIAEKMLRLVTGLFVGLYVARFLGPNSFGLLSFVNSISAIMGEVGRLGLDTICIREYVKSKDDTKATILGSVFRLKMLGALGAFLLTIVLIFSLQLDGTTRLYIAIISIGFFFQGAEVVDYFFQAEVRSKFVSICRVGQLIISSVAKLAAIYMGYGLLAFVWITLIDQVVLSLLLVLVHKFQGRFHFWNTFEMKTMKNLLRDSWPILLSSIAISLYMRVDQIMIKAMLGDIEVGIYTAAIRLTEIWYFVPMTICSTLFPSIVSSKVHSDEKFNRRVQGLFDLMFWISLAPVVGVSFFSTSIVQLLYGPAYLQSAKILEITIWAGIPVSLGVARSGWITANNFQKIATKFVFIGVITKLSLNFLLIPKWGAEGAGWATLVSQSTVAFAAPLFFRQTRPTIFMFIKSIFIIGSFRRILRGEWR